MGAASEHVIATRKSRGFAPLLAKVFSRNAAATIECEQLKMTVLQKTQKEEHAKKETSPVHSHLYEIEATIPGDAWTGVSRALF
jgi:hypothetical protein